MAGKNTSIYLTDLDLKNINSLKKNYSEKLNINMENSVLYRYAIHILIKHFSEIKDIDKERLLFLDFGNNKLPANLDRIVNEIF